MLDKVARAIQGTPFEGRVYLVGGAVRDEILGRPVEADYDLVVEADAIQLASQLRQAGVSTIDPVVYPRFGTAMLLVEGIHVELVTARRERYEVGSRKPHVEPATILEDALRRDFTCNTLMRRLGDNALVDPLGSGLADLQANLLRTPLDPVETFTEDPLRMLRAVRFRHKLGFEYAPGIAQALQETAPYLVHISAERIREELVKMLLLPRADLAIEDLRELGLLHEFWPELEEAVGVSQGDRHPTVWEHVLGVVKASKPDLLVRLAALLHDVAKPRCRVEEKGKIHFHHHERIGAKLAAEMMRRLRFSETETKEVEILVRHHMRFGSQGEFSERAVRRLVRDLGALLDPLLDLAWADREAYRPGAAVRIEVLRQQTEELRQKTPAEALGSPLTGQEISATTGLPPGPEIGNLKHRLEEAVLDGTIPAGDKSAAESLLRAQSRNWLNEDGVSPPNWRKAKDKE